VERGLAAPGDAEREKDGEDGHVAEGDELEGVGAGLMQDAGVKAAHDDGDDGAEGNHRCADSGDEPAQRAVPADVMRPHQRGLQHEEKQPSAEDGGVNPKQQRAGNGGVEEDVVDGVAEAPDDDRDEDERHREVEVLVDEAAAASERRETDGRRQFGMRRPWDTYGFVCGRAQEMGQR
jgi:hypothetical protein